MGAVWSSPLPAYCDHVDPIYPQTGDNNSMQVMVIILQVKAIICQCKQYHVGEIKKTIQVITTPGACLCSGEAEQRALWRKSSELLAERRLLNERQEMLTRQIEVGPLSCTPTHQTADLVVSTCLGRLAGW